MKRIRVIVAAGLVLVTGCATTSSGDWSRFSDGSLDEWLGNEAVPGLTKTFATHPRFKGETVHVAVLDGAEVAAKTDGLSVAVRDAVSSALLEEPGLNIVRVDGPGDCRSIPVTGYFLAVDTGAAGKRSASVELRVYDIVERQWISGFGYRWRGDLAAAQREALQRTHVADSARGLRVAPFAAGESDLLAEHLAAQLACQLRRDGNDELIVAPGPNRSAALIAGNLAGRHGIPVDSHGAMVLDTRVHAVDDELYQVWAILSPGDEAAGLSAIAASAYATHPLLRSTARTPQTATPSAGRVAVPAAPVPLLSPLAVTRPPDDCRRSAAGRESIGLGERPVIAADGCFGLEFRRDPDASLFIVNHRVDGTLVRLSPSRCGHGVSATRGAAVRFPRQPESLTWDRRSGSETFYVVAVRGRRAVARVAGLMSQLPDRCEPGDGYRPRSGWLRQLDDTVRVLGDDIAWEAVRVYHEPAAAPGRLGKITGARR